MEIAMIDFIFYLIGASLVTISLIFYYYWKDRNKLIFDTYLEDYLIGFTAEGKNYVIQSNSKAEKLINAGDIPSIVHFYKLSTPLSYSLDNKRIKKTKYMCVLTRLHYKTNTVESSAIPCDKFGRFLHHSKILGKIKRKSKIDYPAKKYVYSELKDAEAEIVEQLGYHIYNPES